MTTKKSKKGTAERVPKTLILNTMDEETVVKESLKKPLHKNEKVISNTFMTTKKSKKGTAERVPKTLILNTMDEETVVKESLKKPLHKNEKVISNTPDGYLFHKGNGVVYYRSDENVELFKQENELHASEVKNVPERIQSSRG